MRVDTMGRVMQAARSIMHTRTSLQAYGPEIVKASGLSSSAVYSALSRLTKENFLEHRYHGGPYCLTSLSYGPSDQRAFQALMDKRDKPSAPRGGEGSGAGSPS